MSSAAIILLTIVVVITLLLIPFQVIRLPYLKIDSAVPKAEKLDELDKWFTNIHGRGKFNGSVLVAKRGEVVFSKSYGLKSSDSSTLLDEHASFNLASVSKQFTAMAIVLLKERGQLNYHDPLSRYIPELSFHDKVTIRHLLNHTSGVPDYMRLAKSSLKGKTLFTNKDLIALFSEKQPQLNFLPGSKFEYSNTGYVLLAEVVERVSGESFESFMNKNIFAPLTMQNSQVYNLLSNSEPKNRVYGFRYQFSLFGGKKKPNDLNVFDGVAGDGGVYASTHDLFLWHEALTRGQLVSREAYAAAYHPAVLSDSKTSNYGFGWFLNADASVEHAGGWIGFTSYLYRHVDNGELIVILDNSTNTLRVNGFGSRLNSIGLNLKAWLSEF